MLNHQKKIIRFLIFMLMLCIFSIDVRKRCSCFVAVRSETYCKIWTCWSDMIRNCDGWMKIAICALAELEVDLIFLPCDNFEIAIFKSSLCSGFSVSIYTLSARWSFYFLFGFEFKLLVFSEQQQQQQIWKKDFCLCV